MDSLLDRNFEIERIVKGGVKKDTGKRMYRIKWKGFPENESTWESEEDLRRDGHGPEIDAYEATRRERSAKRKRSSSSTGTTKRTKNQGLARSALNIAGSALGLAGRAAAFGVRVAAGATATAVGGLYKTFIHRDEEKDETSSEDESSEDESSEDESSEDESSKDESRAQSLQTLKERIEQRRAKSLRLIGDDVQITF